MDLTPKQLIEDVEFREVRRGYDPAEVDAFLDRVAAAMGKLQQQLAEATARADSAEARARAASAAPAPAQAPAGDPAAAGTEQLQRTLVLAQRTADAAVQEAREEAAQILESARSEAAQHAHEARAASLAELEEHREARGKLQADLALLQAHVETQRGVIAGAVAELQRFLDDGSALHTQPAPTLSDIGGASEPAAVAPVAEPAVVAEPEVAAEPAVAEPEPWPEVEAWAPPVEIAPPVEAAAPVAEPVVEPDPEPEVPTAEARPLDYDAPWEDAAPTPEPPVGRVDGPPPAAPHDHDLGLPAVEFNAPAPGSDAGGPPTEAIEAVDLASPPPAAEDSDDAFLAELRKAMTDDEPLGPRDDDDDQGSFPLDRPGDGRPRPRFGRRR